MENFEVKEKNYTPGSMSFAEGFYGPKGDVGYFMIADWCKAKAIIKKLIADGRNIERVEMGLDGDWGENSMTVWEDGKFMKYDCFEGSKWAEPIIIVYYKDAPSEVYSVWRKEEKITR